MCPRRRRAVAAGCQAKQRCIEQPRCGDGEHNIVANGGEAKAKTHGRHGDFGLQRSWLDLRRAPLDTITFNTKDAAR